MRFNVGDIVRISKGSQFYDPNYTDGTGNEDNSNPCNHTEGEISQVMNAIDNIDVMWTTGYKNSYDEKDLKLVRRP